jgi:hypothetical protein
MRILSSSINAVQSVGLRIDVVATNEEYENKNFDLAAAAAAAARGFLIVLVDSIHRSRRDRLL